MAHFIKDISLNLIAVIVTVCLISLSTFNFSSFITIMVIETEELVRHQNYSNQINETNKEELLNEDILLLINDKNTTNRFIEKIKYFLQNSVDNRTYNAEVLRMFISLMYSSNLSNKLIAYYICGNISNAWILAQMANYNGRKICIIILSTSALGFHLTTALVSVSEWKIIYVFIKGMLESGFKVLLYTYIHEVSKPTMRGILSTFPYVFPNISLTLIFKCHISSSILFSIVFAFAIVVMCKFCPDTHHYYLMKKNIKQATKSLKLLRKTESSVSNELDVLDISIQEQYSKNICKNYNLFIKPFFISNGLLVFYWFALINAFLIFAAWILYEISENLYTKKCTLFIGYRMLAFSYFPCIVVSIVSRRYIFTFTSIGMAVSQFFITAYLFMSFHNYDMTNYKLIVPIFFFLYIFCFNLGPGSLTWAFVGEIYPTRIKTYGLAFAVTATFLVGILFFFLMALFFIVAPRIFLATCIWVWGIIIACVYYALPETQGKTLVQIQNNLKIK